MRRTWAAAIAGLAAAIAVTAVVLTGSNDERARGGAATATVEWQRIEPGGRTRTARGEPYAFWVRRGDPSRLMLFFQEGGGCFSFETCAPGSRFFDDSVDASDDGRSATCPTREACWSRAAAPEASARPPSPRT
jgi:hypothetical protein